MSTAAGLGGSNSDLPSTPLLGRETCFLNNFEKKHKDLFYLILYCDGSLIVYTLPLKKEDESDLKTLLKSLLNGDCSGF